MTSVNEITRKEILCRHLPLSRRGIEIGAFDKPCVRKDESNVLYADILDTDGMRAKALVDGRVVDDVQPVDIVIGNGDLLAAVGEQRFAYVLASHVIEHVPNPIAWFQQIHGLLEVGGILSLAVPDQRFCFDRLRALTPMGAWIEAWLGQRSRPSSGQVFDQLSQTVTLGGDIIWNTCVTADQVVHAGTPREALLAAERVSRSNEYLDVHCSVFTPSSFFQLIRQAIVLDLFHFTLVESVPTIGFEFLATFRKVAPVDWVDALASLPIAREGRFTSLPADFDCAGYLSINADVRNVRLDPVEHYLNYGRREGRRYRT